jgi:hypothetical protein
MSTTDTPVPIPSSRLEVVKAFIGDLARPVAVLITAISAGATGIILSLRVASIELGSAAIFMGAIYTGLGAIYTAKSWENAKQAQATADVAKAAGTTP